MFSVDDDALTVFNDGVFSDCDSSSAECAGATRRRIVPLRLSLFSEDFGASKAPERARPVRSGSVTSVFQVTDYPELCSAGRHWILRYDQPQSQNVNVCAGCQRDHAAPGTTFILPWARDPNSPIRRGMNFGVPEDDVADQLVAVARASVPGAMVFLRNLSTIEVTRGSDVYTCHRRPDRTGVVVEDAVTAQRFVVFTGDFEQTATRLRDDYPGILGVDKREATVEIAVPTAGDEFDLPLHAVLPTQQMTPLGFRLSGSFYPFQNRKRLKFESETDGESEWNRAAVRSGAESLADHAESLVSQVGPERAGLCSGLPIRLRGDLRRLRTPRSRASGRDSSSPLRTSRLIWTANGGYRRWPAPYSSRSGGNQRSTRSTRWVRDSRSSDSGRHPGGGADLGVCASTPNG